MKKWFLRVSIAIICLMLVIFIMTMDIGLIKENQFVLQEYYGSHRVLFISLFILFYILSCSFPIAKPLTLFAGALFGFIPGVIIVSFASTIGATLSMLLSRFLFQDWVQKKFPKRYDKFKRGVEREGLFYVFSLRLIPIFPFFLINLLSGLFSFPIGKYFFVSQLGMLPATVIFVNMGKNLAEIDSWSALYSPKMILSLSLLGLLPAMSKLFLSKIKNKVIDHNVNK